MRGLADMRLGALAVVAATAGLAALATAQAPTIGGFTPNSGPPGTLVKIIGADLDQLRGVRFGGVEATSYWVVTPNHIKAHVPEGAETGAIVVVTDAGTGVSAEPFVVIRPGSQVVLTLAPARPNPSSGPVVWSFTLPRTMHVRLRMFDARGRLVRRLLDQVVTAGTHERLWDARDERGRRVPNGFYVARLEVESLQVGRPVVVVR